MEFRHLKGKPARPIDAYQIKPIVDAMGLEGKRPEEKVFALARFASMPREFGKPKVADHDEYISSYSLVSLHYNEGNCRHRAAMFSALLEAAGISHEIQEMGNGGHTYVHIPLPKEHIRVDFDEEEKGNYISIFVERENQLHGWNVYRNRIRHNKGRGLHGALKEEDIRDLEQLPEFRDGMNRLILERIKAHHY